MPTDMIPICKLIVENGLLVCEHIKDDGESMLVSDSKS